jgi:cyclic 2,3-diphosphoglycerate synthetase
LDSENPIRCLAIIDGEHYPPVVAAALTELSDAGYQITAALLVGGTEKLPADGISQLAGIPVISGVDDPRAALDAALGETGAERVVDLSDEPVLDYRRRHELAAVALARGVSYQGADFVFDPPPRPRVCAAPSIAVIGTGKRTGKTAVDAFGARTLTTMGMKVVVVAMGRGGPDHPEVLKGDAGTLTPEDLVALADAGKHAASDYVEAALLARVTTVGCRRCGGGLAGAVASSNLAEGVRLANDLAPDLLLLEGSGAAIPPAHADATVLVVPASIPTEYLAGYMGPFRLLLSDVVVVTMCEEPFADPSRISSLTALIHNAFRPVRRGKEEGEPIRVFRTVFRPHPTRSVEGAAAYVATTAPEAAGDSIRRHLENEHGCRVVGISHALSDRAKLAKELGEMKGRAEVLLCEIKAAAIDVATRRALDDGLDVVYFDNVPSGVDGDDPAAAFVWAAAKAQARFEGER